MNGLRVLVAVLFTAAVVFGVLTYRAYREGDATMETNAWTTLTFASLGVIFAAMIPYFQRLMDALR